MPDKSLIGAVGIALTLFAFYPYIRSIVRGTARPHVFSWVIWGITTFVVFLAQLQAGGGIGAWVTGVSGTITLGVALLAWLRRADVNITRTDWVYFVLALLSIPLWYATSDPLWAVVVLTTVDLLGFGPTLRKLHAAWNPRARAVSRVGCRTTCVNRHTPASPQTILPRPNSTSPRPCTLRPTHRAPAWTWPNSSFYKTSPHWPAKH